MIGRRRVVVLWDPAYEPPPGPVLDAAALANGDWDWEFHGPPTAVRPPTMVTHLGSSDDVEGVIAEADIVVGLSTMWTLGHVARAGTRFVVVVPGADVADIHIDAGTPTLAGWPASDEWARAFESARTLDDPHLQALGAVQSAEAVAEDIRGLLDQIRRRHLPLPVPAMDGRVGHG